MSKQAGEGVPRGSQTEPSPQPEAARDSSGVAKGSAARGVSTDAPTDTETGTADTAERPAKDPDGSKWIRASFSHRGLAFMLDRPFAAIRDEIFKLLGVLFAALFAAGVIFFILFQEFGSAAVENSVFHGSSHFNTHLIIDGFFVCLYTALFLVVAYALAVLVPAVRPTLREWSRVDNRMALMLSFVALFFLTADSWRLTGSIPWWRLRSLVIALAIVYICVLYRRAKRLIADVLEQPIKSEDVPDSIKEKRPLIEDTLSAIAGTTPNIAGRPLRNLRLVAAILLSRRIIISAILVSAVLFAFGMILLSKQDTLSLMNSPSKGVIGFTDTLGIRNYQFFLSESLLKVSLSLGTIAAAYFVFANPDPAPDPNRDKDTLVTTFIRKTIALWACYQHLTATGQPAPPAAEETGRPAAAEARGAPPD